MYSAEVETQHLFTAVSHEPVCPVWEAAAMISEYSRGKRTTACGDQTHLVLSLSRNAWMDGQTDRQAGRQREHRYIEMFPGFGEAEKA